MHKCVRCGEACDCDGEDQEQSAPDNCACPCELLDLLDEDDELDFIKKHTLDINLEEDEYLGDIPEEGDW